jgi:uncharacterized protein (DUF1501 family)
MNRRNFLKGCAGFSVLAGLRGFGITNLMFEPHAAHAAISNPQSPISNRNDLLVYVFVRGGMDGLNMVTPFNTSLADNKAYYNKLRPRLNISAPNSSAAHKLVSLDGKFGMHPDMARGYAARGTKGVNTPKQNAADTGGLYQLFAQGDLAIVHATGSIHGTGSHFDTQLYVDVGDNKGTSGWVTRYLNAIQSPQSTFVLSPEANVPMSLSEWYGAVAMPDSEKFGPSWGGSDNEFALETVKQQRALIEPMLKRHADAGFVLKTGANALDAYTDLHDALATTYTPAAPYWTEDTPDEGTFARAMQTIARMAKSDLPEPLRVACVDVGGGWDTHDNQGTTEWDGNPRFPQLVANLSNNLKAFHDDMNADPKWRGRFTVIVLSEFGRVLYQNDSGGCDHGSGNAMFVIGSGGNINGGKVYADWPGLETLGSNDGLQITTDYRRVIADVLTARMGASADQINKAIFPGLNYKGGLGIARPLYVSAK